MLAWVWQSSYFKLPPKETFWAGLSFHHLQPLLYLKVHLFWETHTDGRQQKDLRELSTGQVRFCFFLQRSFPIKTLLFGSTGQRTAVWSLKSAGGERKLHVGGQDQPLRGLPGHRLLREKQFLASTRHTLQPPPAVAAILSLGCIVCPLRCRGGLGMGLELGQAGKK